MMMVLDLLWRKMAKLSQAHMLATQKSTSVKVGQGTSTGNLVAAGINVTSIETRTGAAKRVADRHSSGAHLSDSSAAEGISQNSVLFGERGQDKPVGLAKRLQSAPGPRDFTAVQCPQG
jgi:hypothetical protein